MRRMMIRLRAWFGAGEQHDLKQMPTLDDASRRSDPSSAGRGRGASCSPTETVEIAALRRRLLSITLGDAGAVDRMLLFESKNHPGADQATIMRAAIERWELENRSWR